MLNEPLGYDLRHKLACVVLPLSAVEAQRERKGVGEVVGGSWG